ncbi:MAG TPA: hypothetical protein VM935_13120 [Chitinophagaceae bacterium]|nr:hypothetical protein [Chitinophagaceae bacterium]
MKMLRSYLSLAIIALLLASCSLFKKGEGCPSNGKNVGAEKLLDGGKAPKAKKFKA